MKTDKVVDGVLIKATQPKSGKPYVWPKGVTKIGEDAFFNWANFNQPFSIPKSVTEIGSWAFAHWYNFNHSFFIPKGVTEIGEYAFYYWTNFNQPFRLPESVIEIGNLAFAHWYSFNQPNSRRTKSTSDWFRIDNWVFAGCYSGTLEHLRKKLDSGVSTSAREKAWEIISQPFSC